MEPTEFLFDTAKKPSRRPRQYLVISADVKFFFSTSLEQPFSQCLQSEFFFNNFFTVSSFVVWHCHIIITSCGCPCYVCIGSVTHFFSQKKSFSLIAIKHQNVKIWHQLDSMCRRNTKILITQNRLFACYQGISFILERIIY